YNLPVAIRMKGALDARSLEQSLDALENRHESLRTRFPTVEGKPVQIIAPPRGLPLERIALDNLDEPEREAELRRLTGEMARRPFALSEGRLARAYLLRLAEDEYLLLVVMHHIIADGWSVGVLVRELAQLYDARARGRAESLADLRIQFVDYAVWQQRLLDGDELKSQLDYWKRQLGGSLPVLELPSDYPRPAVSSHRGATERFEVGPEATSRLKELGRQAGATLFMVLTATLKVLIHRYTGQQDIILGTPVANRRRREFEPLVGCFVNTLALRTNITGDETFRDFLHTTRRVMLEAYAHQDVPFEKLVEELQPDRDLSHSPLFQVMIASQKAPHWATKMGELSLSRFEADTGTAKFDLLVFVDETEQGLKCAFEYKTELFEPERVARMARHFQTLLSSVASDPACAVSTLPLLPDDERRRVLLDWNRTDAPSHSPTTERAASPLMHEMFEAQAAARPEATALLCGERSVSYGELNRVANRVAWRLRAEGVGPESVVGVCTGRGVGTVAAMLGVLKAGGAYLPLDPSYPPERLAFMLEDARAPVLLTEDALVENLPPTSARIICLDGESCAASSEQGGENRAVEVADDNLAYVIYTSGSTGRPKGVAIEHRSATALLSWAKSVFTPEEMSGVLASTSICFDLSVFEIFLPLSCGGTIILAENALQLPELPCASEVKLINTVPSAMSQLLGMRAVPPSVVTVNLAGEPLGGALARRVFEETSARRLFNLYGPTEDTTYSTFALVDGRADEQPSIGRPVEGTQAFILDRNLQPVPIGVEGELYLSGEGLARGYLNRPCVTAEKFIPHPFAYAPGARLYRTGDLARYRADGRIEFVGRIDHQVKVRGFRIELGEVESALLRHAALKEALVKDYGEGEGKQLVAYLVGRRGEVPTPAELRRFLAERLPDFMIPSAFVALERMPLTPNGKIDRKALPPPDRASRDAGGEFIAPRNGTEALLASVWAELLGVRRVGAADNFFDLGGHSLLATQLVSRLRQAFGMELPLRALFTSPTVAGLAEEIETLRREGQGHKLPPIRHGERDERPPLSFAQQRLWLLDQLAPGNPFYNVSGGVRLKGALDVEALRRSVNEIVSRHEALRTGFAAPDGEPYQMVADEISLTLPVLDLSHLDERERERRLARHIRRDARAPFDLKEAPALRVSLVRLSEREHVLLLTAHHIVFDGRSIEVFVKELGALYEAFRGEARALGELPVQYADYACWQRRHLAGGELFKSQLDYWKKQLGGDLPVLELPADRLRPPVQTFQGARHPFALEHELADALRALGKRHGATLFMTLLAAFKVLLYRYTGQADIVVGSPVAGRNRLEIENLIGFFVNTLALRTDLSGRPSFEDLLGRVRETAVDAYANQDVPFEQVVEELQPDRDLTHSPLFQVMFSLRRSAAYALELPGLSLSQFETDTETAKFDLALQLEETTEGLSGYFEYSTELFEPERVARMARHFQTLLSSVASDPARAVSTLPLLPDDERRRVLLDWNRTDTHAPAGPLAHEMFEAHAAARPEGVALRCGSVSMSYGALNRMANRVARRLRAEGVGPESVVGVCAGRGAWTVAAMLGVLKAGGAYLPLDPAYPPERLAFMLEDARASVLLSERGLAHALDGYAGKTLLREEFDEVREELDEGASREREDAPDDVSHTENRVAVGPENLAYVIYTSGSTGRPKGVMVRHAGLRNLVNWHRQVYEPSHADRVTHLAGLEFDASVWELWPHLAAGASVHIPDEETRLSPPKLVAWLAAEAITVCFLPTPLAEAALQETWPRDARLRLLLVGGDKLQRRPAESLPFKVFNHYGPTENSVVATASRVEADSHAASLPDIGRPISNVRVYLLDANFAPVPVGVPGELCIAGDSLARGYLNRPELTAENFVPDPFSKEPGGRLYRTGDLARFLADGRIEFVGRADAQVKLRGFRIELAEIEAVLCEHEEVREAAALIREDMPGEKRLVAYVVTTTEAPLADVRLREHLKRKLPDYMIPSAFIALEELPLTPNGKVNRRALPVPSRTDAARPRHSAGNVAEAALAAVWAEVLGIEPPGVDDNFFEIGGHSLKAAQVMSRVRDAFGVNLPLRSLFEAPTVAGLTKAIERARRGGAVAPDAPLAPAPRDTEPPLSFAQERLWFLSRLHPDSPAYNISGAVRISGPVSPSVIEESINEIVRRHESLRTTFQTVRGRPVQVIAPQLRLSLPVVNLARLPEAEREAELRRLALAESGLPFDLTGGPLLRATLVLLGDAEQVLLLTIHHIISDGWSVRVFVRELGVLLESFAAGRPSPLAELPVQYADFASWQRQRLEGEALSGELDFWKSQLADAPAALDLPTDHPRPQVQTLRGERHAFELSETLSEEIRLWSRVQGVTMFMTFRAALQVLLRHYTNRDDIVVGADIAERNSTELENLIGLFVNQLVLRVDSSGLRTFTELLRRVREVTLAAYDHRQVPFNKIVEAVKPEIDLGRNPLFQVMLVFESEPIFSLRLEGLSMKLEETDAGGSPFDFSLVISDAPGRIRGAFRYSTDLFEAATIERMAAQFETILSTVVARTDIELKELRETLARADKERLRAQARELKAVSSRKFERLRPRAAETVGGD
ncbi:MAG TPA: amino acid adenylation domain-containing protein, partial [Pyrinomonadaceae bacterium]|nr:amino acid adenylation domain-containing protein [Pyrinomonadaceae bacterium]